jgi:hypothetical protein
MDKLLARVLDAKGIANQAVTPITIDVHAVSVKRV